MKKTRVKHLICILFMTAFVLSLQAGSSSADVNVHLPIAELQSLVAQLQKAGEGVVGKAGTEMRSIIDELSAVIGERLNQLAGLSKNLWTMMYGDLSKELAGIKDFLLKFTQEVNQMVKDRISQIDSVLAKRIDQLADVLKDIISQVDNLVQHTIESAKNAGIEIITQGEKSIITVLDNAAVSIVRMILIVVLIIVLLVILILAWKNILPKSVPAIIICAFVGVLFVGGSLTFIFSNKAMSFIFGRKIELAETKSAEQKGNKSFDDFMNAVKNVTSGSSTGTSSGTVKKDAEAAIRDLLTAKYVAVDPKVIKSLNEKILTIQTLIYPPPKPDSDIKVGTFSKDYKEKVKIIKENAPVLKIKPDALFQSFRTLDSIKLINK